MNQSRVISILGPEFGDPRAHFRITMGGSPPNMGDPPYALAPPPGPGAIIPATDPRSVHFVPEQWAGAVESIVDRKREIEDAVTGFNDHKGDMKKKQLLPKHLGERAKKIDPKDVEAEVLQILNGKEVRPQPPVNRGPWDIPPMIMPTSQVAEFRRQMDAQRQAMRGELDQQRAQMMQQMQFAQAQLQNQALGLMGAQAQAQNQMVRPLPSSSIPLDQAGTPDTPEARQNLEEMRQRRDEMFREAMGTIDPELADSAIADPTPEDVVREDLSDLLTQDEMREAATIRRGRRLFNMLRDVL